MNSTINEEAKKKWEYVDSLIQKAYSDCKLMGLFKWDISNIMAIASNLSTTESHTFLINKVDKTITEIQPMMNQDKYFMALRNPVATVKMEG